MPSAGGAICVACGSEMAHPSRSCYRRCRDCVSKDRPHSLVLARYVRATRLQLANEHDDYDPAGLAAA
jgi:predicted nucleic acid-binding Zn ribbon protein